MDMKEKFSQTFFKGKIGNGKSKGHHLSNLELKGLENQLLHILVINNN